MKAQMCTLLYVSPISLSVCLCVVHVCTRICAFVHVTLRVSLHYHPLTLLHIQGIVLWELLTQEDPFPEIDNFEVMLNAVCKLHERPVIPADCPPTLRTLMGNCWAPEAEKRTSTEMCLCLPVSSLRICRC